jgi:GTP-binding protein Era
MPYRAGFITIIGRPNVGKSTLLNQILGQKISIVSDKPQTTRNKILGVLHRPDGQMVFLDTPGVDQSRSHFSNLNSRMTQTTFHALREVDLILFIVDRAWGREEEQILSRLKNVETPKVLVLNKIDLVAKPERIVLLSMLGQRGDRTGGFAEIIPISAKTGDNTQELLTVVYSHLPEGTPYFPDDQVTDQPVRFLASEMIREAVIERTRNEIPHVVSVQIDTFRENEKKGLVSIQATIFVERDSQRGILIGKAGEKLKLVGQAARYSMENLLDTKVFLELWVKVRKDWRKDDLFLNEMGY